MTLGLGGTLKKWREVNQLEKIVSLMSKQKR